MKNQWMAYVIVAVISALAGVAVAGAPNNVGTDSTIVVPETTTTTTLVRASTAAPDTADQADTESTDDEPASTTTTTTIATATTTTTVPAATTTVAEAAVQPAALIVVSVNGAGTAGLATRVRDELRDFGYDSARATDGTTLVDTTIVYYFPGLELEAVRVAEDLGLEFADVAPIEGAPEYGELDGDQVVVYLGRDRS